jgi:hypothetical protein
MSRTLIRLQVRPTGNVVRNTRGIAPLGSRVPRRVFLDYTASILIRETGQTAVINARGAYDAIADGVTLQVDPILGEVRLP